MLHTNERIIKHKVGLLNLAEELGNVARACQLMGISRDTFYRYKDAVEDGGVDALLDANRKKANLKNRVDPQIEVAVVKYAIDFPAHGQVRVRVRVSNELRKAGVFVSPSGVRSVWLRHALERKKLDDEACGEIETVHPSYLGSQDTFYVGTLKGVGRIYQQTYVDTYCKVAQCKLYTTKTPITAADLLNDRVLPFYEQHSLPVLRVLTDRGTEYCGNLERHDYQLYLAVNEIEHTRTRVKSPQTNGICERFHKTVLQEFYQVTFRKKIYASIAELQTDLDSWLDYYNNERTHQGKMCCGRTPMDTLLDGKRIWKEKFIA